MEKLFAVLALITMSVVVLIGDYFLKLAGNQGASLEPRLFVIGFAIESMTTFGWFYAMRHLKLATVATYYSVLTVLMLAALGSFAFDEKLNLGEMMGIGAALVALVLLARFA
jgi:undecaprenyl phosphate-alpha-L-ara4N flippase subunit ArnF